MRDAGLFFIQLSYLNLTIRVEAKQPVERSWKSDPAGRIHLKARLKSGPVGLQKVKVQVHLKMQPITAAIRRCNFIVIITLHWSRVDFEMTL